MTNATTSNLKHSTPGLSKGKWPSDWSTDITCTLDLKPF